MKKWLIGLGCVVGILILVVGVTGTVKKSVGEKEPIRFSLAEIHEENYPTSLANKKFASLVE